MKLYFFTYMSDQPAIVVSGDPDNLTDWPGPEEDPGYTDYSESLNKMFEGFRNQVDMFGLENTHFVRSPEALTGIVKQALAQGHVQLATPSWCS